MKLLRNIKNEIGKFIRLNFIYAKKYPLSKFNSVVPPIILKSKGSHIGHYVRFHIWNGIKEFGDYIFIGNNTLIQNCASIGSFSSISDDVKIGLVNHRLDTIGTSPYFYHSSKGWLNESTIAINEPVVIEADVLISANVFIIEGVRIGVGSVVGAGSVVTKNIPPYAIVGGIPAKVIKYRFDEEKRAKLIESKWWLKDDHLIKRNAAYFDDVDGFLKKIQE